MQGISYIPVFLSLKDFQCLVVGGGKVALRKIEAILDAGIAVRVVSPEVGPSLERLYSGGRVKIERREFQSADLEGVRLVIAATDDPVVNERISTEARLRGVICNVVDQPSISDVIMPSIVRRGRLQIAISTGGGSPAMARWMRVRLSRLVGVEYGMAAAILSSLRRKALGGMDGRGSIGALFYDLLDSGLVRLCKRGNFEEIRRLIHGLTGIEMSLAEIKESALGGSSPRQTKSPDEGR